MAFTAREGLDAVDLRKTNHRMLAFGYVGSLAF